MSRCLLLTLALGASTAHAAAFEPKTMRDTLPALEVERGLVLGKGWLEFGVGADVKMATGYWDSEGEAQDFEDASWTYTTERLDIRYGVARRGELYWTLRTHYVQLQNDALGTDNHYFGFGDPVFGYKWEAFRSMAPATSVVLYAQYKAPAANEAPGNYVGGPNSWTSFVLTTGTPDLTIGARGKRQVGPLAFTVGASQVRRFSNVVQYLIETEQNQFQGRIKPGDLTIVDGEILVQIGPVALQGAGALTVRQVTKTGTSSPGIFADQNLVAIDGSEGWAFDLTPGAVVNLTRGLDVDLAATIPMRGEDLQFFPIEDIHPTRGLTLSGTLEFRY